MIDTIKGNIDISKHVYNDFVHLIDSTSIKSIKNEYYTISLNLSNFIITLKFDLENHPIKLSFTGSLPKLYYGNNMAQLDWKNTQKAIEMLSHNLNVDLNEATLTRIDFGINFILKYPIHRYLSCLVKYPCLKILRYEDSVTFFSKSGSKSIIFYDKINEMKTRRKTALNDIPDLYHNKNILRYEMQFKKRLNQILGLDSVKIKHLFNDTHQKKLTSLWLDGYEKVIKLTKGIDPLYLLNKRNGIIKYLAYHGAEKLGYDSIINNISDLKFDNKNPLVKISKMKATLNELLKDVKDSTLEENLVAEMDNKIKFIRAFIS